MFSQYAVSSKFVYYPVSCLTSPCNRVITYRDTLGPTASHMVNGVC